MFEWMTTMPEQTPVTCVQLPGQETKLELGEMANASGGCSFPGEDPLEHLEDITEILDDIYDIVSEWWG